MAHGCYDDISMLSKYLLNPENSYVTTTKRFARVLLKVIQVNAFLRPHAILKANENFHKIHLFTEKSLPLFEVLFYIVIIVRFIITSSGS